MLAIDYKEILIKLIEDYPKYRERRESIYKEIFAMSKEDLITYLYILVQDMEEVRELINSGYQIVKSDKEDELDYLIQCSFLYGIDMKVIEKIIKGEKGYEL